MENFDSEEDGYMVEAPSEEAAENEDVVETASHNQAQQGHHQPAHNDQVKVDMDASLSKPHLYSVFFQCRFAK
jgi:hypothetical protein